MERHPAPDSIDTLVGHAAGRRRGTIVVVDVVESVRLVEQDEAGVIARWQGLVDVVVRRVLPGTGGRLVKSLGDGMMLAFDDPRRATEAAFAIQRENDLLHDEVPPERRAWLRIGAHLGEHVVDAIDVYGRDVNLAARLSTLAGPGEIVVSTAVRDQVAADVDAEIEDLGDCFLKHVSYPVRAFRLGPPGNAPQVDGSEGAAHLRPLVAVVPFEGRVVQAGQEMLGEIIADEVIAALSRSHDIDVMSRMSTTALKGRGHASEDLAGRVGADHVLTGSYRVAGGRIEVTATLCEVRGSRVFWVETLRGRVADVVWGRGPLLGELVRRVRSALTARAIERVQTQSFPTLETFTLMLAAVASMYRLSPAEFERAREALEAIVERVPRLAIPRAWLAQWHVLRLVQGWTTDPQLDAQRAFRHTRSALDLNPDCALALAVDGILETHFGERFEVARDRFDRALSINPNEPMALANRGMLSAFRGEGAAALRDTLQATRLSPADPMRFYFDSLSASAAIAAGEPSRALRLAQRSFKANRLHASTLRILAVAQWQTGAHEDARRTVESLRTLEPGLTVERWLARSPSRDRPVGRMIADCLAAAGLPH
jgi:class 3 adenylate cyclase/TolB-like protein